MHTTDPIGSERRQYIRLDSVFPVGFAIVGLDAKTVLAGCLQGFTNNVSKGGLCLEVNNLVPEMAKKISARQVKIDLNIEMPLYTGAVKAQAAVAWVKQSADCPSKYYIGLIYESIDPCDSEKIIRYARVKKMFIPVALSLIIVLSLAFALGTYLNVKLIKGNKALVENLVKIVQDSSVAKMKIKLISREKEDLEVKIRTLESRIQTIEEEKGLTRQEHALRIEEEKNRSTRNIAELNAIARELSEEKDRLQEQLIALQDRENVITEDLLHLDKRRVNVEKANLDKIYAWLKVHQNRRTGLIASFEGDKDIQDVAFIYDQALVAQAYTNFSDLARAQRIFDFFKHKAKRAGGLFFNAYYAGDASPAEYVVHSGPNIWVAIAIVQYTHVSNDKQYLDLAEEIAGSIIKLQDNEGGVCGGPGINWYSTEHNLDAYALFNMLYKLTGKEQYQEARDKVLAWIRLYSYSGSDLPMKRGKGDSTIATDTYAWAIASIGPAKLEESGMNPDRIIEFAEQVCSVEVSHRASDGSTISLKGFDFAAQRNMPRGGVISSEWTAQMVITFKIMAEYYFKQGMIAKARSYLAKAEECLLCLSHMITVSPSSSGQGANCLPYANQDFVDTGHGWFTPKGKCTGSVAGTTYALFAFYNYNPLELKD